MIDVDMKHNLRPFRVCRLAATLALTTVSCVAGCASLAELDQASRIHAAGVAGAEARAEPMTLPRYLGLDVCARRTMLFGQVVRGKAATVLPALAPQPLALPLSHPANADSPSPAVAAAHKVKKAKAAKVAKVKAVAVLAGQDCSVDPHVEEGLLAALDDAAADVRIAAVNAVIRSTRGCGPGCGGCCSPAIRAKLTSMVFDQTGPDCWSEPSSKARRLARLALDACGGPVDPNACGCQVVSDVPLETPPADVLQQVLHGP